MIPNANVEFRNPGWYIRGSRVSVDSVIYAYRSGETAETISRECFPTLSVEEAGGAIAFYLDNQKELDAYLEYWKAQGDAWSAAQDAVDPAFLRKLVLAREKLLGAS